MRILILGNNYSAKSFYKYFSKNEENIVFSNIENSNYTELSNTQDTLEFCLANDINLVLIIDEDFINQGYQEILSANNISVFCPSIEAISVCTSASWAKKFMYKNKIQTPKFFVAEKPQVALEYIMSNKTTQIIKPENNSFQEGPQIAETFSQAQKYVNNFFNNGNKKIIIEDYIEGKNINVWTISNGYSAEIIAINTNNQNDIALFEPDFITNELKTRIQQEIINPTISSLSSQDEEYIGVLGFDIILTYDNKLFLLGYNSFFNEISVDFYTKGFNSDWGKIFDKTIVGDVFQECNFKFKNDYMLTIRQNEKINLITASTKNGLEKKLNELDFSLEEYFEAKKIWEY